MSESYADQLSRVRLMSEDKGETWDLSPNDQAAVRAVLARLDELEKKAATTLIVADAMPQRLRDSLKDKVNIALEPEYDPWGP